MSAARETFAAQGLDAQMDDIAARAGVGVGTVYRHFPTKEALIDAVAREGYEQTCRIAREALEQNDPWDAFSDFMWRGARLHNEDRAQCEINATRPDVTKRVAGDKHELLDMVGQLIERGQRAGVIRADLSTDDMPMIWCSLGAAQQYGGATTWERYLEVVLDGLRAR
jgi:AcrR family transcriptional regulator